MDLFAYWSEYKVLICWKCKFAVPPDGLRSHLHRVHGHDHVDLSVGDGPAAVAKKLLSQADMPLLNPKKEKVAIPEHKIDASPFLDLYSGYQCTLCPKVLCRVGDEEHLYVVPATNLRCLHLRAKFSHGGAGLGGVVRTKGL
jgi:hypothetical protein